MKKIIPLLLVTLIFCISAFSQEVIKMQEFENPTCEEYLNRMDSVIAEAQNNPSATIYIFVYEGKENIYNSRKQKRELKLPTVDLAKVKINSMNKFMKVRVPSIKNITFIEAGFVKI